MNDEEKNIIAGLKDELRTVRRRNEELERIAAEAQKTLAIVAQSEKRCRRLFESAKDSILLADARSGSIIEVNEAVLELSGYSLDEFYGKKLWEIAPLRGIDAGLVIFRELQSRDRIHYDDLPFATRGGASLSVELVGTAHELGDRRIIQCTVRDISERKRIEEERWQLESRYQALFRQAALGIAIMGADGAIVEHNPHLGEIFGYGDGELRGRRFAEFVLPEDLDLDRELMGELTAGSRSSYQIVKRCLHKSGAVLWALATVSLIRQASTGRAFLLLMVEDITDRKQAEEVLRKSAEEINDLYNNAPCGYHSLDNEGTFVRINDTELSWLGYSREELIGKKKFSDLITPKSLKTFQDNFPLFKERGWVRGLEFEMARKDGTTMKVLLNATALKDAKGGFIVSRSTVYDITDRTQAEQALGESRQLLQSVLDILPVGVWITDRSGRILAGNPAGKRIWAGERLVGIDQYGEYKGWWSDTGKLIEPEEWAAARAIRKGESSGDEEIVIECFDKTRKTILNWGLPIRGPNGEIIAAVIVNQDITRRKQAEEALQKANELLKVQAATDTLTGIYNRLKFTEFLDQELHETRRYRHPLSLIMFDIDYFKRVNDTYGHLAGDSVLHELASLVSGNIRQADVFSRWGGEEFMILATHSELEQTTQLAEKMRALIESHAFVSCPDNVTCSFGVTAYLPGDTVESLTNRADNALYRAKNRGRNRVEVVQGPVNGSPAGRLQQSA